MFIGAGFAIKLCRDYCKSRANRLKKSHLNQIPVKKFAKGVDSFDTCAICLEDFVDGDKLRILSCNHAYHMKCIDPWLLKQKRNCPVCKSRVKIRGRMEESDDNISVVITTDNAQTGNNDNTPLINPREGLTSRFDFGSAADIDFNFTAGHSKSTEQHCYDNPCIESNEQDTSGVNEPMDSISSTMSINNDATDNQCDPCLKSFTTDNTTPSTSPKHVHHPSDDDLTKMV